MHKFNIMCERSLEKAHAVQKSTNKDSSFM